MDYKFLVKRLRAKNIKTDFGRVKLDICDKAADAIETLLAERDAVVESLRYGGCKTCKHQDLEWYSTPCKFCKETGGMSDHWEWRSPKKGSAK